MPEKIENLESQDSIRKEIEMIYSPTTQDIEASVALDGAEKVHPQAARIIEIGQILEKRRADFLERQNDTAKRPIVKAIGGFLFNDKNSRSSINTIEELKARESEIGAAIFGETLPNQRREFFCHDVKNWYFYQEQVEGSEASSITLHYEIYEDQGILKVVSQPNVANRFIEGEELDNFMRAVEEYHKQTNRFIHKSADGARKKAA